MRVTANSHRSLIAPPKKHPKRKQKAEETLECYPVETPFLTKEDVSAYLGLPPIRCLRCGKKMRMLPTHLVRCHGWTADQYKQFYGIPWGLGLVCPQSSQKMAVAVMKRVEAGELPGLPGLSERDNSKLSSKRPRSLSHINSSRINLAKAQPDAYEIVDGVAKSRGKKDKHKKAVETVCNCGATFVIEPHNTRSIMCVSCQHKRRLERRKLRRSNHG